MTNIRVEILNRAIEKFGLRNVWTLNGKIYINDEKNKVHVVKNKNESYRIFEEDFHHK